MITTPNPQDEIVAVDNPYVGPESFGRDKSEFFHGRDQEVEDLSALVAARRLVLLYAESGAGKTSLINAGLLPVMEARGFEVLPVTRPGGIAPSGVNPTNLYAYNVMLRIDRSERAAEHCAELQLADFLLDIENVDGTFVYPESLPSGQDVSGAETDVVQNGGGVIPRRLLIIDQFEELFTTQPGTSASEARSEFLQQLAAAMKEDSYLYVLLSMRADYVHHLTRYVHLLPDDLETRYYMSRMRPDQAKLAVEEPARRAGRPFAPGVAQELVERLAMERSQEDPSLWVMGETVEPVQLQVVCSELWQSAAASDGDTLSRDDLVNVAHMHASAGDPADSPMADDPLTEFVNSALAIYYEQSIRKALDRSDTVFTEARVREWFSDKLITKAGTRGFLQRQPDQTEGVPEPIVEQLVAEHILRSELRSGGRLVELIHDSFIDPVRQANERWFRLRFGAAPWIAAAQEWDMKGRPTALLLTDDELVVALNEAAGMETQLAFVNDFLKASEDLREAQTLASNRRLRQLAIGLFIAIIVAVVGLAGFWRQSGELGTRNAELAYQGYLRTENVEAFFWQNRSLDQQRKRNQELGELYAKAGQQLAALSFRDLAAEALGKGNHVGALLFELAAREYDADAAFLTLPAAMNDLYRSGSAEGIFRVESTPQFTSTEPSADTPELERLYPGVGARTLAAVGSEHLWTLDRNESGLSFSGTEFTDTLLAVSNDGSLLAVLDNDNDEVFLTSPVDAARQRIEGISSDDLSSENTVAAAFYPGETNLLLMVCRPSPQEPPVGGEPGATVTGDSADNEVWSFQGIADDEVTIVLERADPNSDYDPVLYLQDSSGSELSSNDDALGRDSQIIYTLPSDDTYQIIPSGYGDSSGDYRLTIEGPRGYELVRGVLTTESLACQLTRSATSSGQSTVLVESIPSAGGVVNLVAFDDDTVVWIDGQGSVWALEFAQSDVPTQLLAPDQMATALALIPEIDALITGGRSSGLAADGSSEGYVQRWRHSETGFAPQGSPLRHSSEIRSLVFLAGEEQLAALDGKGIIVNWQMQTEAWADLACSAADRNMTFDEWEDLVPALSIISDASTDNEQAISASVVCDEYGLDISFAEQAAELAESKQTCSALTALPLAARASSEAQAAFVSHWLEVSMDRLLGAITADDSDDTDPDDSELIEDCLDQSLVLMGEDAPDRDALMDVLTDVSDVLLPSTNADRLVQVNAQLDGVLPPPAARILRERLSVPLIAECDLAARGQDLDLLGQGCRDLFDFTGLPHALVGRNDIGAGRTDDTQLLWSVSGEANDLMAIALNGVGNADLDLYLEILNEAGAIVTADDDTGPGLDALLFFRVPETGTYYLRPLALHEIDGEYELRVDRFEQSEIMAAPAETVTLDEPTVWYIDHEPFERLSVRMDALEDGVAPLLLLQDDEGQPLGQSEAVAGEASMDTLLTTSGRTYLLATNAGEKGGYDLAVELETPAELGDGQVVTGNLTDGGAKAYWSLAGEAGDLVSIAMERQEGDSFDPVLNLYDAQGNDVDYNDDYGGRANARIVTTLPSSGRYIVGAKEYNGLPGQYTLRLDQYEPQPLDLPSTQGVEPISQWSFTGQPGRVVYLRLTDALDIPIEGLTLAGPGRDTMSSPQSTIVLLLAGDEPHVLTISSDNEDPLQLMASDDTAAVHGGLSVGETVDFSLGDVPFAYWTLDGDAGSAIAVSLTGASGGTTLALYDPDGRLVSQQTSVDDQGVALIEWLPSDGTFIVGVESSQDDTTAGRMSLTLSQPETVATNQSCGYSFEDADYGTLATGSRVILGEPTEVDGIPFWGADLASQYIDSLTTVTEFGGVDDAGCPWVYVAGDAYSWRIRDMQILQP